MKLNILMFYNKKIECFTQPVFDDHEVDVSAQQLSRSLTIEKDVEKVNPYKNLKLYHLGKFDDQTGKIDLLEKPQMILDCSEIVEKRPDYVESSKIKRAN